MIPDRFVLSIELGNAEMTSPTHVAQALRRVADKLTGDPYYGSGLIHDINGNVVGQWRFASE